MTEYTLPHFGVLSTGNLENDYSVDIDLKGDKIRMDLNFENNTIDASTLNKVKIFIENIEHFYERSKTYILDDYNNKEGETVKSYLEHHLEVVDKDKLSTLINFADTAIEPEQQLLTKLKVVRIGLYPDKEDRFAVFDYSIGKDITNYLVVIYTDGDGHLSHITMES